MPHYDLSGKVALITGGARGIGLGLAQALVARGANVVLADIDGPAAVEAAVRLGDERALGLGADVTDAASIDAAVATAVERFGGVDLVVANAGIAPMPAPVRVMAPEEFERVVEVNLLGVYRTIHGALEQIIAHRGQVVVISSVYAFVNGIMASPYAVAKAGVEQLGRALALELAPHGASATVAYFGFVDTQMVHQVFDQRPAEREREMFPAFMLRRISPAQAGEALARGIERRQQRVIAPRWWAAWSALRGILNPGLDFAGARTSRVHETVREAETEAGAAAGGAVSESSPPSAGAT